MRLKKPKFDCGFGGGSRLLGKVGLQFRELLERLAVFLLQEANSRGDERQLFHFRLRHALPGFHAGLQSVDVVDGAFVAVEDGFKLLEGGGHLLALVAAHTVDPLLEVIGQRPDREFMLGLLVRKRLRVLLS